MKCIVEEFEFQKALSGPCSVYRLSWRHFIVTNITLFSGVLLIMRQGFKDPLSL